MCVCVCVGGGGGDFQRSLGGIVEPTAQKWTFF